MNFKVLAILLGVLQIMARSHCTAQNDSSSWLTDLVVADLKQFGYKPSDLRALREPIPLTSAFNLPSDFQEPISSLWTVPDTSQIGFVSLSSTNRISSIVLDYFSNPNLFEFGEKLPTEDQKRAIVSAKEILFEKTLGVSSRSIIYKRYQEWQESRNSLVEKMESEIPATEKQQVNRKLTNLDRDYAIEHPGEEGVVKHALETLATSSSLVQQFPALVESLKRDSTIANDLAQVRAFYSTIATSTAWIHSDKQPQIGTLPSRARVLFAENPLPEDTYSVSVHSISFDALIVPINADFGSQNLFANTAWRRKDGLMLGGEDGSSGKVPHYVKEVLVVRDIRLGITIRERAAEFQMKVAEAPSIYFGIQRISLKGPGAPYALIRQFVLPRPLVVAVLVANSPKIPNPDTSLTWK